jgi:hypothetical protein
MAIASCTACSVRKNDHSEPTDVDQPETTVLDILEPAEDVRLQDVPLGDRRSMELVSPAQDSLDYLSDVSVDIPELSTDDLSVADCPQGCPEMVCGIDKCGNSCGACEPGWACQSGACVSAKGQCVDFGDSAWDGCTNGEVSEFSVAAGAEMGVSRPRVTVLSAEKYVVAWADDPQPPQQQLNPTRLFFQVLRPLAPLEQAELLVHTVPAGISELEIAGTDKGSFVAAWTEFGDSSSNGCPRIAGLVVTLADGVPSMTSIDFGSSADGSFGRPAVVPMGQGEFAIAWSADCTLYGSDGQLLMKRFDALGTPLADGQPVAENTDGVFSVVGSRISAGGIAVGWTFMTESFQRKSYVQQFNQFGDPIGSPAIIVSPDSSESYLMDLVPVSPIKVAALFYAYESLFPKFAGTAVAFGGWHFSNWPTASYLKLDEPDFMFEAMVGAGQSSGFAVVWQTRPGVICVTDPEFCDFDWAKRWKSTDSTSLDGDGHGLILQLFDHSGEPGSELIGVNKYATCNQYSPDIGSFPDGSMVVVWESEGQFNYGNPYCEVQEGAIISPFAQRFAASGDRLYR